MSISTILGILTIHYVFDWCFQSRKIAETKSDSVLALGTHCLIYGIGLFILTFTSPLSWLWVLINLISHFCVDFVTSKLNKMYYLSNDMSSFWVGIGFDQYLHYVILFVTAWLMC